VSYEEPVRFDGGESGKDPARKIGPSNRKALGQDDGGANAGTLFGEYAVGGGRSDARKGRATRMSDGTPGKADGVIDGDDGKEIWRYQLPRGRASTRGVSYWPGDKDNPPRILFTSGNNLVGLNGNTGKLDPGFGKEGIVNMVIGYGGVPTIFKNTVMVGANSPENPIGPAANTRAFDARIGAQMWEFHNVAFGLGAQGNANPMVFQGRSGKEYVVIAPGRAVHAFALQ
jgi:hypothetical protein